MSDQNDTIDFRLFTKDLTDIGIKSVTVISTLIDSNNDSGYRVEKSFTIKIRIPINKPPYFSTELRPQKVENCYNLWTFTFPKMIDPNHAPVNLNVEYDKDFFSFDDVTKTIS